MFLNIFDTIRDFFKNMIDNISFSNVITLIFGIFIGIFICMIVYLVYFLSSIKKQEENNKVKKSDIKKVQEIDYEMIDKYILASKDEYKEASVGMKVGAKFSIGKEIGTNLAYNIAKMFYPKSKHPFGELSVEELIELNYYITKRIEDTIDGSALKVFKKLKVSFMLNTVDTVNKINDNKIVKSAKKMHIGGIASIIKNAINIVNPVYYIKKGTTKLTMKIGVDKIICILLEIVGQETAKIYSKNVFVVNDSTEEIISEINEIENEGED